MIDNRIPFIHLQEVLTVTAISSEFLDDRMITRKMIIDAFDIKNGVSVKIESDKDTIEKMMFYDQSWDGLKDPRVGQHVKYNGQVVTLKYIEHPHNENGSRIVVVQTPPGHDVATQFEYLKPVTPWLSEDQVNAICDVKKHLKKGAISLSQADAMIEIIKNGQ